jgi:hypothetical protein
VFVALQRLLSIGRAAYSRGTVTLQDAEVLRYTGHLTPACLVVAWQCGVLHAPELHLRKYKRR